MGYRFWRYCLVIPIFALVQQAHTGELSEKPYYGKHFYELLREQAPDDNLKQQLHLVLSQWHHPNKAGFDRISDSCTASDCFRHSPLSYKRAREILFGLIHLSQPEGQYAVDDVYCDKLRGPSEFKSKPPGPYKIPDHTVVNAEHTWPQSQFSNTQPKSTQKSDLHALYPVDSRTNSSRSNHPFGEAETIISQICPASRKGRSTFSGRIIFEPPENHKGNVARALFYFAIRYNLNIDQEQEHYLRQWHQIDPVDLDEMRRNQQVFEHQSNRNPFIDHPELIAHFQDL